ncbi:hypothetical protein NXY11_06240 [Parabacteroides faecis]|uniref:hypothetical protein n=1 Tax=Parabacteroides faecis TaxID=1217282 RepID=UPI0021640574|nr:hypothetical protein [Parabacteroides faecis]MCS2893575.1 hypothetical protein [Parabacteroides faecis]UVQ47830.1 hypothetical protein NXY11_06240 [Parabacteroides faecis]
MKDEAIKHIIDRYNLNEIVDILSNKLSGSELNSLLLEVFERRVMQETPSSLLGKYTKNKLVKPAQLDFLKFKEEELECCKIVANSSFELIELSPVAQLGTSSIMATVNQKKVLTALRNTEVQSDPTNSIALHYASLKKNNELSEKTYNFSNVSRVIRTQVFSNPNFTPHFPILCLISCGMDTGSFEFEKTEIYKHFAITQDVCKSVFGFNNLFFEIIPCKEYDSNSPLISNSLSHIKNSGFDVRIAESDSQNNYYYGMRIKTKIIADGVEYEIGDGGLLDWTQKLLANKKERMLTMGLGIQLLHLFRK